MQNGISQEWPIEDKFGISRLPLVSMYREPGHGSGLVSQILFGETYSVQDFSNEKNWIRAKATDMGVEGWISSLQHKGILESDCNYFNQPDFLVTTSPVSYLKTKDELFYLLPGSQLPSSDNELFEIKSMLDFQGETRNFMDKADRDGLIQLSKIFLNAPYLSGGRSLFGIDSGAFLQLSFKLGGYQAPRFVSEWIDFGSPKALSEIEPGDVVIFSNELDIPFHCGLYVGEEQIIHVRGKVLIEKIPILVSGKNRNKGPNYGVYGVRNLL